MASIIKVDQIQTAAGGTPTAADLGINTTGNVIQVVQYTDSTARSWSGSGRSTAFSVPGSLGDGTTFIERVSNTSQLLVQYSLTTGAQNDSWSSFIVQYAPAGSGYTTISPVGPVVGGIDKTGALAHFGSGSGGGADTTAEVKTWPANHSVLFDPNTSVNKVFLRLLTSYGHDGSSRTIYLNRPHNTGDDNRYTGVSRCIITEIAG